MHALHYTTFDKVKPAKRAEVVENKRLDDVLSIIAQIAPVESRKRFQAAPERRGCANHMFAVDVASREGELYPAPNRTSLHCGHTPAGASWRRGS